MLRNAPSAYGDGLSTPAGSTRPSARAVSSAISAQRRRVPNSRLASDFVWQWGQFLDHDLDLTEAAFPAESFAIAVPIGDPFFDPSATGAAVIPMDRSVHEADRRGVRQQLNQITAWIDASNVYGSDRERAAALRTVDGTGRLKTSRGNLLPFNVDGLPNGGGPDPSLFLAGDVRANEQAGLTCMHTLFVREHNAWADLVRARFPSMTGDLVYETARMIVGAEMQAITYNEFLPVLLGRDALGPYTGYNPQVDARIANEFSTASYRFGHSMLSPTLSRLGPGNLPFVGGDLPLRDAFFAPSVLIDDGIDSLLRGLAHQAAQEVDTLVVDDVRNFLFGRPGAGGFDLASLNVQRGRDHGLADYNSLRRAYGLRPVRDFGDISSDPSVVRRLQRTYRSVDDIDPWVGGLAEDHVSGGLVGSLVREVLVDQFERLRAGDRFWYERTLPRNLLLMVQQRTLRRILIDNTGIQRDELPRSVFRVAGEEGSPTHDGRPEDCP